MTKFLQWFQYNWTTILIFLCLGAFGYHIYNDKETLVVTTTKAKKPLTEKQKAWKHWQEYWSFHEPLKDAWPHKKPENYLYYIKDSRTEQCFAVATPFGPSGFMASVPCHKVKHLIDGD
jgi:hypothetical protein